MLFIEIFLYRQDFTQVGKQAEDRALPLHEGIRREPEREKKWALLFPNLEKRKATA